VDFGVTGGHRYLHFPVDSAPPPPLTLEAFRR